MLSICKKNENTSIKHNYDSQDDLENLIHLSVSTCEKSQKSYENDNNNLISGASYSHKEDEKYLLKNLNKQKNKKTLENASINLLRFLNSLSIIILLVTFYTTSISKINQNQTNEDFYLIMEYLKRDKIQAESNLLVLYLAFSF